MKRNESRRILQLPVDELVPNPMQPRRSFDEAELAALADSITQYGILQPLTVRRTARGYELIAGERRLRAAKRAGLHSVPCVLAEATDEDSALLALIENLQRRDLDYLDEAEALARLLQRGNLTQEELARRISRSQSAVANKLRLLRLSPEVVFLLRQAGLSERHARALLRLPEGERVEAAEQFIARRMSVAEAERYVDERLNRPPLPPAQTEATPPAPARRTRKAGRYYIKDVRIFFNSLARNLALMRSSGLNADCTETETEREYVVTIRIEKTPQSRL